MTANLVGAYSTDILSKFDTLVSDIFADFNDPIRTYQYEAYYADRDTVMRIGIRLAGLVCLHEGSTITEIGTDSGFGALTLALFSKNCEVYSCDIREESIIEAKKRANRLDINNVHFVHGDVDALAAALPSRATFAHVDAHHTKEACLRDLEGIYPYLFGRATLVVDDVDEANGVRSAVDEFLQNHPELIHVPTYYNFWVLRNGLEAKRR